jgi:hypothetical protein
VGHVPAQEEWEIVRLPAIAEDDETIVVDSLLGLRSFQCPARRRIAPGARAGRDARADPALFQRAYARMSGGASPLSAKRSFACRHGVSRARA